MNNLKDKTLSNLHKRIPKGLVKRDLIAIASHHFLEDLTEYDIMQIEKYITVPNISRYTTRRLSEFFNNEIVPELPYEFNMQLDLFAK